MQIEKKVDKCDDEKNYDYNNWLIIISQANYYVHQQWIQK